MKKHWKTALELVCLAIVIFAVVVGATHYWRWRSTAAAQELYEAGKLKKGSDPRVAALTEIVDDYSHTSAGKQAMMQLGDLYLKRGDFNLAEEQFKQLAGKSRNHPMLYVAAMHRFAETKLTAGKPEEAAEVYLKAAADPHNLVRLDSRLRAAACLEKAGEFDRAAKLYHEIIEEAGDDDKSVKLMSEERLIWLTANRQIEG